MFKLVLQKQLCSSSQPVSIPISIVFGRLHSFSFSPLSATDIKNEREKERKKGEKERETGKRKEKVRKERKSKKKRNTENGRKWKRTTKTGISEIL